MTRPLMLGRARLCSQQCPLARRCTLASPPQQRHSRWVHAGVASYSRHAIGVYGQQKAGLQSGPHFQKQPEMWACIMISLCPPSAQHPTPYHFLPANAVQAAKLHAADPTGEGGQDSCSSGSEPCGGQELDQGQEEGQQQQSQPAALGEAACDDDGASLSHDPAPLEPRPTSSEVAGSPTLAAASECPAAATSSPPNSTSSSLPIQHSPASSTGAAEPGPVAQLQGRLDALPQEPAEPAEPQVGSALVPDTD